MHQDHIKICDGKGYRVTLLWFFAIVTYKHLASMSNLLKVFRSFSYANSLCGFLNVFIVMNVLFS